MILLTKVLTKFMNNIQHALTSLASIGPPGTFRQRFGTHLIDRDRSRIKYKSNPSKTGIVGEFVGESVTGLWVGEKLGKKVGFCVGLFVGRDVGFDDGGFVGDRVVGLDVGC